MIKTLSIVADCIAVLTFLVTAYNLSILKKLRFEAYSKRYYPKKISDLEESLSNMIMLLPLKEDKKVDLVCTIKKIRIILSEIAKSNTVDIKLKAYSVIIKSIIVRIKIRVFRIKNENIIRYFYSQNTLLIYKYKSNIDRIKSGGNLNGR